MTDAAFDTPGPDHEDAPRGATRSLTVTERIRTAILAGDFEAGARLHEVRLSERLGVSRTPVRSALQSLASEGLLEYAPNRGYAVRRFSTAEIVDAYEIRAVMEALAARFAAERGLPDQEREAIERVLADGDDLLARTELGEEERIVYSAINGTFHEAIHSAARCRMLTDMVRLCHSVPHSSHRNVISFEHMDVRRRHDDHHRIYDAILACDAYRAEMLMREHVASVKTSLVRALSGRPLPRRGR
ncbi:GntR family transcriptional regulator [Aquabacter spiritensis]|uniref:GntR family transcriptional regulator n=1 Tax=Aquabacter spiritensis TaxID=933073 RepID=A0A4R3LN26_9HYPH|nr:GntR family transcriptional regulator [Aquabacter spiritensis]TCT01066.1 GntR family transcriptional regulator [Aquabacter spiritensis]